MMLFEGTVVTHIDGAEMQREAARAVFVAAGLVTLMSLGAAYAIRRLTRASR